MFIKFLRFILPFILLLSFQKSFAIWFFGPQDPDWLVKIESTFRGNTITGTGYVVQIGSALYVRTASHVTIGARARVQLYSGSQVLKQNGDWISNNLHDDQLIGIDASGVKPLAIYMPKTKIFVVNPQLQVNFQQDLSIQAIQRSTFSSFFIVPSWSKRSIVDFEHKQKSRYDENTDGLKFNMGASFIYTDLRILPGESGSPVIGYLDSYRMYKNGEVYTGPMKDETKSFGPGNEIFRTGMVPVVFGHLLSYMYDFPISTILSPYRSDDLPSALLSGIKGRDISNVQWNFSHGIFYRELNIKNERVVEANFYQKQAGDGVAANGGDGTAANGGDGTAANGGDGTAANGGDGTAANGGDGTAANGGDGESASSGVNTRVTFDKKGGVRISSGLNINTKQVLAFEVYYRNSSNPLIVYANWDNYFALKSNEQVGKISPIFANVSVAELILRKVQKLPENSVETWRGCLIDKKSLNNGSLNIRVDGFGDFNFSLKTEADQKNFFPIIRGNRLENQPGPHGSFAIDLRGLYSIDLLQMSLKNDSINRVREFDYFSTRPYVVISYPDGEYKKLLCYAFENL